MTAFIGFGQNIALLFSLTFLYGFVDPYLERLSKRWQGVVQGLLFAVFAVISMTIPIQIKPGLFYDGRTIVICIAGLYGGWIPALIAAVVVALYRLSIGGMGVPGALASIITAVTASVWLYRIYRAQFPSRHVLIGIGLMLALLGSVWGMIFSGASISIIETTLPTTFIFYPVGLLLLAELLNSQRKRREIERALANSERRFHAIFDSSFEFIVLLKPDGTVLEANQTVLNFRNVQFQEVRGVPLWDTMLWNQSPERQRLIKDAIRRAANGETVRHELVSAGDNQTEAAIDLSIKPLRDHDAQIISLIAEGRDITPLKQLEQQRVDLLVERERSSLLKKFISDLSHDFRTPLAVMRLNLELLRRMSDSPKQQQRIDTVASQEQHLTRLLTDMLMLLSFDDSQGAFKFKLLDFNFVAKLVFDTLHNAAQNKQQQFTLVLASTPVLIQGDQIELERALNKLITNAINYSDKPGSVTLSVHQQGSSAVVEISDTGIGISADDLPNIFQRFFRADQARSIDTGGTGLGLPIAQKIADAHGGKIEVESTLGSGSTFRLMIPLADPLATPGSESAEELLN